MRPRPQVVAFDVIGTVFSIESLRDRLSPIGLPPAMLDVWFARILRDAFALDVSECFQPFREIALSALRALLIEHGARADSNAIEKLVNGFTELDPYPDAEVTFRQLHDAGFRIMTLTNGSVESTRKLLHRAGLEPLVERVVSIDEVGLWKPRRDVYFHAAGRAGVEPHALALVAAHAWDTHGAARAGLTTVFISRGRPYPTFMAPPHLHCETLLQGAEALLRLADADAESIATSSL